MGPTLREAQTMLAAAVQEAELLEARMALAVVDRAGFLVAAARMDGASLVVMDVAIGNAVASALFRQPSGARQERWPPGAPLPTSLIVRYAGGFIPHQGALPIVQDGEVIGAIGASGATAQQDEDVARAGLAAFQP